MSTATAELAQRYKQMDSEELLVLHQRGGLSKNAYLAIEGELSSRGVGVPPRPPVISEKDGSEDTFRSFLVDHWRGKRPLWSAYWIVFVLGAALLTAFTSVVTHLIAGNTPALSRVVILAALSFYLAFATVSVWRCASASEARVLGFVGGIVASSYSAFIVLATLAEAGRLITRLMVN